MRIELIYSPAARAVDCVTLVLDDASTVAQALQASGLMQRHPEIDLARLGVGVWGRRCSLDHALRDGDRVEVYRPLQVEPKEARRRRQHHQGRREATKKDPPAPRRGRLSGTRWP